MIVNFTSGTTKHLNSHNSGTQLLYISDIFTMVGSDSVYPGNPSLILISEDYVVGSLGNDQEHENHA